MIGLELETGSGEGVSGVGWVDPPGREPFGAEGVGCQRGDGVRGVVERSVMDDVAVPFGETVIAEADLGGDERPRQ